MIKLPFNLQLISHHEICAMSARSSVTQKIPMSIVKGLEMRKKISEDLSILRRNRMGIEYLTKETVAQ